jgi:CelD/BcsL family acetyltransferase involved in cellulose biosynthesis
MNALSMYRSVFGYSGLAFKGAKCEGLHLKASLGEAPMKAVHHDNLSTDFYFEVLRGGEGLNQLAPHWDKLLNESAVKTPFMSWDWSEIWWRHFEVDYKAVFGVAWSREGHLLALVPLVIGPGQTAARKRLRHLAYFAGLGDVVAEGLDSMALPGHEDLVKGLMHFVFDAICGEWDTAHFGFADESSPFFLMLCDALKQNGAKIEFLNRQASPIVHLADKDWDSYLMERSGNFRKKFRRISAAATSDYQMSFREPRGEVQVREMLEELFQLHGARWAEEQSLFLRPRAKAFHRELAKRWVGHRRIVLLLMDFLGQPVAANYAFAQDGKMWDYQGGWKPEHIDLSPAKLLNAENIRRAMAQEIREIDMLPGNLEYKSKWTGDFREVVDLVAVNPNSFSARFFELGRFMKRAISGVLKSEGGES